MTLGLERLLIPTMVALALSCADVLADDEKAPEPDLTVRVSAFDLPPSEFLSAETRAVLKRSEWENQLDQQCPVTGNATAAEVVAWRMCEEHFYQVVMIPKYRARYGVAIQHVTLAGVPAEIITPVAGVSATNRQRVLVNLHGGAFMIGAHWIGQVESIPIAAVGKIKIVSVNYRMAPEYKFPAASEDVAAVYKALLREYKPENIGIYGCSAGGVLTAESVAWFQREGLPRPGAIGMFCAGASLGDGGYQGDSGHFIAAIAGNSSLPSRKEVSYFRPADLKNPLAAPWGDPQVMAKFPDSLLITSTRDPAMSSVVATHSQLVRLGVRAELHVWEGLDHGFFFEPDLPESHEAYVVIAGFFNKHLGNRSRSRR